MCPPYLTPYGPGSELDLPPDVAFLQARIRRGPLARKRALLGGVQLSGAARPVDDNLSDRPEIREVGPFPVRTQQAPEMKRLVGQDEEALRSRASPSQ